MRHLAAYMKPDYVVFLVSFVNEEFHSMHLYLGRSFMDCTQQCLEFVYAPSGLDDSHIVKLFNHCVCFCVINNSCHFKMYQSAHLIARHNPIVILLSEKFMLLHSYIKLHLMSVVRLMGIKD